mgnify:CR=1 FL=1|tara:strand:+ start:816 stop:1691 length:876 start_codon:yes stop_codon:yes gene_type:complete
MRSSKVVAALCAAILAGAGVPAKAASILFAQVDQTGPYVPNGNTLAGYLTSAGHSVTVRHLNTATFNDYASFDQVWVYDLFGGANNNANQLANYANIANWYNGRAPSAQNLIADGRIISSNFGHNEPGWIQGYAHSLDIRGGGLVLGTDHDFYVAGINTINAAIGIDPFFGNVPVSEALVDQNSGLFFENGGAGTHACGTELCIWDNSSPSFAPTGLQSNGTTLTPVAYHGTTADAFANAAVSSTIGSVTFGTCGGEGQPACTVPEPGALATLAVGLGGLAFIARRRRKTA